MSILKIFNFFKKSYRYFLLLYYTGILRSFLFEFTVREKIYKDTTYVFRTITVMVVIFTCIVIIFVFFLALILYK